MVTVIRKVIIRGPVLGGEDSQVFDLSFPTWEDVGLQGFGVTGASGPGASDLTALTLDGTHYDITGDRNIDAVLIGAVWDTLAQTFSFPTDGTFYAGYSTGENVNGFSAFNAAQQTAARYGLGLVSQYTDMVFTEITETATTHADHRFANSTDNDVPSAYGNFPSDFFAAGDAWFNLGQPFYSAPQIGNWGQATVMHEIGHTMGLKHGHSDYTAQDLAADLHVAGPRFGTRALEASVDGQPYSLMTYRGAIGQAGTPFEGDQFNQPQTYMLYDIAALQFLYGANYNTNSGNSVYTFSTTTGEMFINGIGQGVPSANIVFRTVWDGNGIDTDDLGNYTTPLSLDLNPGGWLIFDTDAASGFFQRADNQPLTDPGSHWAPGNVANALLVNDDARSLIENAIGGSAADQIFGNRIGNILDGRGANDTIDGRDGSDTAVYGGARSQYLTTDLGGGSVRIQDLRSGTPDGTDTDSNVEFFQFANGTYTLAEVINQPPVLSPDAGSPHALTELAGTTDSGIADTASGSLSFTDEASDTHTASDVLQSAAWSGGAIVPAATLTALSSAMSTSIAIDGSPGSLDWQFSLADRNVDFLAVGETLQAVYDVTVADQLANSSTVPVTIVFTGTNDVPTVIGASSVLVGSIAELPGVTGSLATDSTSGVVAFADVDLNDRPTATIGTQTVTWQDATHDYTTELSASQIADFKAALQIAAQAGNTNNGSIDWTYDIVDNLLDFVAVGESITVSSKVTIDDDNGGTVSPDVVVTLVGANDAPVAVADSNGTAKHATIVVSAGGGVLSNDFDPDVHDNDDLFVSQVDGSTANVGVAIGGTYGALTLNADGSYSYAAFKGGLPPKIVAQDTFDYTVADGHGGTDTSTLSIVVFNPGAHYQSGIDTTLVGGNGPDVLDGSYGGDLLLGGNGPDVLIGGDDDTLTGGNGPDTFLFRPEFGTNLITDFDVRIDAIQFDASLFANAADILAHTTDTAGGAVITDAAGDTVTLAGVAFASLAAHSDVFQLA
jgi:VCBS repeat-containing protein